MLCHSQAALRQLRSLCSGRFARLATHCAVDSSALLQRGSLAELSKQKARVQHRSLGSRPAGSYSDQHATLSRPAAEVQRPADSAPPLLQDVEQQLGPFSAAPAVAPPPALVVIISGPSGVGKDAVINRLRERRPDIHFVVTATSRPRREGEVHGVDYFFVSKGQFEEWLQQGQLLEHAVVYGDYKGIPRQQVMDALAANEDVVLRIDVQGAATVHGMMPDAVSIFLTADNEAELVQRLVSRKTETMENMAARIRTARSEAARMPEFDYVVVNQDGRLEDTVQEIEAILAAEKRRVSRRCPS